MIRTASHKSPPRSSRSRGERRATRSRHLPGFDATRLHQLGLSRREIEVLELVAEGRTNEQVALALGLSAHTVKMHLERMRSKLGVHDRAALVAVAWQRSGREGL